VPVDLEEWMIPKVKDSKPTKTQQNTKQSHLYEVDFVFYGECVKYLRLKVYKRRHDV